VLSQPQARQDGYTLLLANAANAINAMLYEKLDFNFIRDIAPVAASEASPIVLAIHRFGSRPLPNSSPMPKPIR
jgi:tripartite-type tricarboxylate transporter receptor subunit TctC